MYPSMNASSIVGGMVGSIARCEDLTSLPLPPSKEWNPEKPEKTNGKNRDPRSDRGRKRRKPNLPPDRSEEILNPLMSPPPPPDASIHYRSFRSMHRCFENCYCDSPSPLRGGKGLFSFNTLIVKYEISYHFFMSDTQYKISRTAQHGTSIQTPAWKETVIGV